MPSIDPAVSSSSISEKQTGASHARVSQFAYIRAAAGFAIVLLHCINGGRVYHAETISAEETLHAFAACSALMWAVPCFLMMTGALLLDPARSMPASKLFGKYIRRMLTALIVFTLIFTIIRHDPSSGSSIVSEFFDGLLFNHCMAYLWYLYLMIFLYLLMPLFRMITAKASDRQLLGLTLTLLLISSVLPLAGYAGIEAAAYIPTWIVYPAYLFIGWLLLRNRQSAVLSAVIFAVCTPALPLITILMARAGIDSDALTAYNSPLVVLQSAAAFALMLCIHRQPAAFTESAAACSFGIYLIHMIFVRLTMCEAGFDPFAFGPFGFIGSALLFYFLSYAVTFALKKFPLFGFL